MNFDSKERVGFQENFPALRTTAWWAGYFQANAGKEWRIPWEENPGISAEERERIGESVAEFQRGESSEARNYLAKSARFAAEAGEPSFHEASVRFVGEENAHAALLLRFMRQAGIAARPGTLSDGIFRRIRAVSDIGWSSRVLIIAELVAQEYYPLLKTTTGHPVLRRVCTKLIQDEFAHIRFQVERIARAEAARGAGVRRLREGLQTVLALGAALVVYREHRGVLGPLGCGGFVRRILRRNHRVITAVRRLHGGAADQGKRPRLCLASATR